MLAGLKSLTPSEVEAFAREAKVYNERLSDAELKNKLIYWMGSLLNASGESPENIEKAALSWLSNRLGMDTTVDAPVEEVERLVRRKIAEDSYEFLFPFLMLGSAVSYLGPAEVIGPKLELLEAAASGLIPSIQTREKIRIHWQNRNKELQSYGGRLTAETLLAYLQESIDELQGACLETKTSIVLLNHVIALSDGRYEQPEELFLQSLAQALGVDSTRAAQIGSNVSEIFWKKLASLEDNARKTTEMDTKNELTLNMQAAQLTLESAGVLSTFSEEAEQRFASSLNHSLTSDPLVRKGLKAGKPLGFALGVLCYIKERWRYDEHKVLLRLLIITIINQHIDVIGDDARVTTKRIENYLPQHKVENVMDILAETTIGDSSTLKDQTRRISLDS